MPMPVSYQPLMTLDNGLNIGCGVTKTGLVTGFKVLESGLTFDMGGQTRVEVYESLCLDRSPRGARFGELAAYRDSLRAIKKGDVTQIQNPYNLAHEEARIPVSRNALVRLRSERYDQIMGSAARAAELGLVRATEDALTSAADFTGRLGLSYIHKPDLVATIYTKACAVAYNTTLAEIDTLLEHPAANLEEIIRLSAQATEYFHKAGFRFAHNNAVQVRLEAAYTSAYCEQELAILNQIDKLLEQLKLHPTNALTYIKIVQQTPQIISGIQNLTSLVREARGYGFDIGSRD